MNGKIYSDRPQMEMRNILLETRGKNKSDNKMTEDLLEVHFVGQKVDWQGIT